MSLLLDSQREQAAGLGLKKSRLHPVYQVQTKLYKPVWVDRCYLTVLRARWLILYEVCRYVSFSFQEISVFPPVSACDTRDFKGTTSRTRNVFFPCSVYAPRSVIDGSRATMPCARCWVCMHAILPTCKPWDGRSRVPRWCGTWPVDNTHTKVESRTIGGVLTSVVI